jgi:hypothetical protein
MNDVPKAIEAVWKITRLTAHGAYARSLAVCCLRQLRPRHRHGSAGLLADARHARSHLRHRRSVTLLAEIIRVRSRRIVLSSLVMI